MAEQVLVYGCVRFDDTIEKPLWKEWNKLVPFLSLTQLSLTGSTCTCMVKEARSLCD